MKWNMGWMHDTLEYMRTNPSIASSITTRLTSRCVYAFNENFVLPLSHDEVVHGKGSLIGKMPGDEWQQFANLRLLFGYMWAHPGKKLLFMGGEFGQRREWTHEASLDWGLLRASRARGHAALGGTTSIALYRGEPALHELDFDAAGLRVGRLPTTPTTSVLAFLRQARTGRAVLVVCNFTPVPRENYVVGVPRRGRWRELLNSDAEHLRRQRHRATSAASTRPGAGARALPFADVDASAARCAVPATH